MELQELSHIIGSEAVQAGLESLQDLVLNPFRDWQPVQVMSDGRDVGRPLCMNYQSY